MSLDGSTTRQALSFNASLTFGAITAGGTCAEQTIAAPGALTVDRVDVHNPVVHDAGIEYSARVATVDVVTVRACNYKAAGTVTPAGATTYYVTVWKSF